MEKKKKKKGGGETSFFGLAVRAILILLPFLFVLRFFAFVETGSSCRRFRFRGEQRIIRDHELSQVASHATGAH